METVPEALQWATTLVAQAMLAWLGTPMSWQGDQLGHASGFVAQLHGDCTAWWPALGLLIALGGFGALAQVPARRLVPGAAAGVLVMALINQARLVAVLWTGVHTPALFGWMHEVLGPLMLVAAGAAVVALTVRGRDRVGMPGARRNDARARAAPPAAAA